MSIKGEWVTVIHQPKKGSQFHPFAKMLGNRAEPNKAIVPIAQRNKRPIQQGFRFIHRVGYLAFFVATNALRTAKNSQHHLLNFSGQDAVCFRIQVHPVRFACLNVFGRIEEVASGRIGYRLVCIRECFRYLLAAFVEEVPTIPDILPSIGGAIRRIFGTAP